VALLLPFVGVGLGIFIYRMMIGPAARTAWTLKRKRAPGLFHLGRDGIFKLWGVLRSFGGVWHAGTALDVIPDERGVKGMVGGTPIGVASTHAAATLDPEWLYVTNRFADKFASGFVTDAGEQVPKMAPPVASNYLDALRYRETEILSVLETLNRISGGEISIEDGVNTFLTERGIDQSDEAAKTKVRTSLLGAIETQGQSYRTELMRIQAAKKITFSEDRWVIDWDIRGGGGIFRKRPITYAARGVMAIVPLRLGDFPAFLQTGANLDDLTTTLRNSNAAAILESSGPRGHAFKWISLGVFIFIVMLSIYIVLQGMHLV